MHPNPSPFVAPVGVVVQISTPLPDARGQMRSAEHVRARFDSSRARVEAGRDVYDAFWDGPTAEPRHPGDWHAAVTASASSAVADAVAGLRDALAGVDFAHVPSASADARGYATFHVRYESRPLGVDHLRPWQDADGSWVLPVRTSVDDLLAEPRLAPVVDAARAVLAALG